MRRRVDALEAAFLAQDPSPTARCGRSSTTPAGTLLLMPAAGAAGVGVKLVTLTAVNPQRGLPFIHAALRAVRRSVTQQPEARRGRRGAHGAPDGARSAPSQRDTWRSPDAARLAIFGAGVQARAHLEAMLAVRPDHVGDGRLPYGANGPRRSWTGPCARVAPRSAARTTSATPTSGLHVHDQSAVPVFDGGALAPGTHVNAVGALPARPREVDTRRCGEHGSWSRRATRRSPRRAIS